MQSHSFRTATEADAEFIAWIVLNAMRSHKPKGVMDYAISGAEDDRLDFLSRMAAEPVASAISVHSFEVALVDGEPAAACSAFPAFEGYGAMGVATEKVMNDLNWGRDERLQHKQAFEVMFNCFQMPGHDFWALEFAATKPAFQGRGLMTALLERALRRGRERGFAEARIHWMIGNNKARNVYVKAGFVPSGQSCHPGFEQLFGSPGVERAVYALS